MDEPKRAFLIEDWEGSPYQKWAKNFCYRNYWRVRSALGDYDDCMQKCALDYVVCRQRYGMTCNHPSQFMYLYKIWVVAEFDTLSVKDSHIRETKSKISKVEPTTESDAQLMVKLSGASDELKQVLKIFLTSPQEMMDVLRQEASSYHPVKFFRAVLKLAGIPVSRTTVLAEELKELLK